MTIDRGLIVEARSARLNAEDKDRVAKHDALLARVREDIDSAKENGYDLLGTHPGTHPCAVMTDREIAEDMAACTTGYEDVDDDTLASAVAAIRAERAK